MSHSLTRWRPGSPPQRSVDVMPRSSSRKFQGLLTDAPKPLPDDDEPESAELPGAERPEPTAAAQEPVSAPGAAAAAVATPEGERGGRTSRPKSVRLAPDAGPPPPASAGPAGEA